MAERDLEWACEHRRWKLVRELIETGEANVHEYDDMAIQEACLCGQMDLVEFLVEKGANPRVKNDISLVYAAYGGFVDMICYLIAQGCDGTRSIVIEKMAQFGSFKTVRYLVEECGVNLRTTGRYAISCAVESGHFEMIKWLLSKGADYRFIDWDGLVICVGKGCWTVFKFLVDNYNVTDPFTPWSFNHIVEKSANAFLYIVRRVVNIDKLLPCVLPGRRKYDSLALMMVNLTKGTIVCRSGDTKKNKEWRSDPYYDPNLGMLVLSYID